MKNNKRSPLTIARQKAFADDLGIPVGVSLKNALAGELGALAALSSELIGQEKLSGGDGLSFDRPQARIAMEATAQGYRENCPELYGRAHTPYAMFTNGLPVFHDRGTSADCELSETDAMLASSVSKLTESESHLIAGE